MGTNCSILAWEIPQADDPGGTQLPKTGLALYDPKPQMPICCEKPWLVSSFLQLSSDPWVLIHPDFHGTNHTFLLCDGKRALCP